MKLKNTIASAGLCLVFAAAPIINSPARTQRPEQAHSEARIEADFTRRLEALAADIRTIECDFTLLRTMSFMEGDVLSRGKFYYLRGEGIALEFTDPAGDAITMGRERFRITSGGRTNVVRIDSNPMLGQLKRMLTACMTGDVKALAAGADLGFEESGGNFVVRVTPHSRRAKGMVEAMVLTFEKERMSLVEMTMHESSGDSSRYSFENKVFNRDLDPSRFEIE